MASSSTSATRSSDEKLASEILYLKQQLEAKEDEIRTLKISFDDYVESSKELETELEGALDDVEKRNKDLVVENTKVDREIREANTRLAELTKNFIRLQESVTSRTQEISILTQQQRDLEQLHESSEEKLRQAEFSVSALSEKLTETEEAHVLLQCEVDELRAEKLTSESRLKAELTELQGELAQLVDASSNTSVKDMFGGERGRGVDDASDNLAALTSKISALTSQLAAKDKDMESQEIYFRKLEAKLRDELAAAQSRVSQVSEGGGGGGGALQVQEAEARERKLRRNLELVQTELAQVQTESHKLEALQKESLSSFKSSVRAEQQELSRHIEKLQENNKSLGLEVRQLRDEVKEKDALINELREKNSSLTADDESSLSSLVVPSLTPLGSGASGQVEVAGSGGADSPSVETTLAELKLVSDTCHTTLKKLVKDWKVQSSNFEVDERENQQVVNAVYNTSTSVAAKLSVKLSQLTDQYEVLSHQHHVLKKEVASRGGRVTDSEPQSSAEPSLLVVALQDRVRNLEKQLEAAVTQSELKSREDRVGGAAAAGAELTRLRALVSELKDSEKEHQAKCRELRQSNDELQSFIVLLNRQKEDLAASVEKNVSQSENVRGESEGMRREIDSYAQQIQSQREAFRSKISQGEETIKTLNEKLKILEQTLVEERSNIKHKISKETESLSAKLAQVEGEKEVLRKKINDFVALGDMREVAWRSERDELTKSIKKMSYDINLLRRAEKQTDPEWGVTAGGVSRISLDLTGAPVSGSGGQDEGDRSVIDSTSRSRLAAKQAIKSGDLNKLREELLHQVYRYEQLREHNAKLLQKIQQKSNAIQVCCRVRPPSEQELGQGAEICIDVVDDTELSLYDKRMAIWKAFEFDKVWDEDAKQMDVFADVEPLALSAIDGYNACIFAYGMTGSGKTYTMSGYGTDFGASYRIVHKIFELLTMKRIAVEKGVELRKEMAKKSNHEKRNRRGRKMCSSPTEEGGDLVPRSDSGGSFLSSEPELPLDQSNGGLSVEKAAYSKNSFSFTVTVSMLEIYNETVKDLLNTDPSAHPAGGLEIRHDEHNNIHVPGLISETVHCLEDVLEVLGKGSANRATSSTNINEHSSRSHSILIVSVTTIVNGGVPVVGKLSLVDLAGSEKIEKSGAQGAQLKEAQCINRSLSALGDVLEALENKAKHIPYRNSKLTYLLQDSLGGNSRTMMIVTVCPTELTQDESLFCLQFASRARNIQLESSKRNISWKTIEESLKLVKQELKDEKKKVQISGETIKELKNELKLSKEKIAAQMGFKIKNSDESRKSGELQIQVLTRTNAELMLRLQEETDQMKTMFVDIENNQKAYRRAQEQLKHCKAERDRIASTLTYKDQENQNLREMIRLYEENEELGAGDSPQQENLRHNIFVNGTSKVPIAVGGKAHARASKGTPEDKRAAHSRSNPSLRHSYGGQALVAEETIHRHQSPRNRGRSTERENGFIREAIQRQPSPGHRGRSRERDNGIISYEADGKNPGDMRRNSSSNLNGRSGSITRAQEALEKHQERMRKKRNESSSRNY